jgi:cell division protease FtsH
MGTYPVVRTVLFWLMMIALAAVLWQMSSRSSGTKPRSAISYSDFMNQVDKNNVASAKLVVSQDTAEIRGQLRDPVQNFSVTIPKEVIPELTERLRKQGTIVEVAELTHTSTSEMIINFLPIILIVGIWVYMMRRMQNRRSPPSQGGPANGALG